MIGTLKIYKDEACTRELENENGVYRLFKLLPSVESYYHKETLYVKNTGDIVTENLVVTTEYNKAVISLSKTSLDPGESCLFTIAKDMTPYEASVNVIKGEVRSMVLCTNFLILFKKIKAAENHYVKNTVIDDYKHKIKV